MISEVDVCNSALLSVGARMITSLLDDSNEARICNQIYPGVRDACLRMHPWNCVVTRVSLGELSTTPSFEFAHQYQLPSNNLRVLQLNEATISGVRNGDQIFYLFPIRYRIEGQLLLTDETSANIVYVKRVTEVPKWDAQLADLIVARMAAEIAYPITKKLDVEKSKWEIYGSKLPSARTSDGMEETHETLETDDINFVRLC